MSHLELAAIEVIHGARRWCVLDGDCLAVLDRIPSSSVDSICSDPPAGVSFMGSVWDSDLGSSEAWINCLAFRMREALRVLKPGGHALVWALPRTSHWTGTALELAGFEIRDVISHLFGSGFPKSLDVSKEIDRRAGAAREILERTGQRCGVFAHSGSGTPQTIEDYEATITAPATADAAKWNGWGSALKPAVEFWILCRKPLAGSIARNVLTYGTGALNIDGCRVPHISSADFDAHAAGVEAIRARGGSFDNSWKNSSDLAGAAPVKSAGRWPAHLVISHSAECRRVGTRKVKAAAAWDRPRPGLLEGGSGAPSTFTGHATSAVHHSEADGFEIVEAWECADGCPALLLDEQSGETRNGGQSATSDRGSCMYNGGLAGNRPPSRFAGDVGSASRYFTQFPFDDSALDYEPFFYSAKSSTSERENGCEHLPEHNLTGRAVDSPGTNSPRAGAGRKGTRRNHHPTAKSVELMRWLCRLITPPDGIVLDPFCGSGSTGVACSAERFRFIGIELSPEYAAIARARILGDSPLLNFGGGR